MARTTILSRPPMPPIGKPARSPRAKPLLAVVSLGAVLGLPSTSWADNPIIQTRFTADPAPLVHDGVLYVYTTHDEDTILNGFFTMNDWRVYSSTDAVNWTDHGSPLHYNDFRWARGDAWAGQAIHRNGKFYFYVPMTHNSGARAIGVAVSESPTGPFEDALGEPLTMSGHCHDIDPSVFIDDDEQAYLYWGNPELCYVRLNEDMVSYQGGIENIPLTPQTFGARSEYDEERASSYEEGPWIYKREGLYYMVFAAGPISEHIGWSTSPSPTGPWTYGGAAMPTQNNHSAAFTNHPGVVDYKGKSLFFYHNQALSGDGFQRSVCVDEFTYGPDGSIPEIQGTLEGASAVDSLNPFAQVEAETIAWEEGVETEPCSEGGLNVTDIDDGDTIKLKEVEFGEGATSFDYRVASDSSGGAIELRLDGENGSLIGTCAVDSTGSDQTWATQTCTADATGKHDLYLRFTGGGFKFNWWQFDGPGAPGTGGTEGTGGTAGAGGVGTGGAHATGSVVNTGGATTSGGTSPAGGTVTGGATATGGVVATGSAQGLGGGNVGPGSDAPGATDTDGASENRGCSCRVAGERTNWGPLAALGMIGLVALRSFRRRSRRTRDAGLT